MHGMIYDPEIQKAFALLGLNAGASEEDVKRAFRKCAKLHHPDRYQADPDLQLIAAERLKRINGAYACIKDYFLTLSLQRAHSPVTDRSVPAAKRDPGGVSGPQEPKQATKKAPVVSPDTFRGLFARVAPAASGDLSSTEKVKPVSPRDVPSRPEDRKSEIRPRRPIIHRKSMGRRGGRVDAIKPIAPIAPISSVKRI